MRSTGFLSLLSVATIANALPLDGLDSPAVVGRALVDRYDDGQYKPQGGAGGQASAPAWKAPASSAAPAWQAPAASAAPAWQDKATSVAAGWGAKETSAAGNWGATPSVAAEPVEGEEPALVGSAAGPAATGKGESGGAETTEKSGGAASGGGAAVAGAYKEYRGNGDNWPKKDTWVVSFDKM